jgi:hypothetical protein
MIVVGSVFGPASSLGFVSLAGNLSEVVCRMCMFVTCLVSGPEFLVDLVSAACLSPVPETCLGSPELVEPV